MWAQQGEGRGRDRDQVLVGGPCGRLLGSTALGRKGYFCIRHEKDGLMLWLDSRLQTSGGTSREQEKPEEWERLMVDGASFRAEHGPLVNLSLRLLDPNTPSCQSHPMPHVKKVCKPG